MTIALEHWKSLLGEIRCVCCSRGFEKSGGGLATQHHVAKGSSLRNEFSRTVLCEQHHYAFHSGMGGKAFCALYRPPGDDEFGLVVWAIEDVMRLLAGGRNEKKTPHAVTGVRGRRAGVGPRRE